MDRHGAVMYSERASRIGVEPPAVTKSLKDLLANEALRTFLIRTRYLVAVVLLVPLAWAMRPELLPAGILVSLAGQAVQTWCFASLVKNRELTVRGPYVLVRNPMYIGRYFLLLGFVLLLGSPLAVAIYTVGYVVYMVARVAREERRLHRGYGAAYADYCAKVHRFWPSFSRLGDRRVWFFSKELLFENHALWNAILTIAAFGALYGIRQCLVLFG
jgi:protein-S-isoprenylcysteine O-methyltransferase Ste14